MTWEWLRTLSCQQLWRMRMYHYATAIGTKSPVGYPLPRNCVCHLRFVMPNWTRKEAV